MAVQGHGGGGCGVQKWRGKTGWERKALMLGKMEGRRRRGRQKMRWLDGVIDSMNVSLSKLGDGEGQRSLVCCSPWSRSIYKSQLTD